jgi:hypothetical protein
MNLPKIALLSSFALLVACTTVNVDPSAQGGPDRAADPAKPVGSSSGNSETDGSAGGDSGAVNPAGGGEADAGSAVVSPGVDAGGGGGGAGADAGGGGGVGADAGGVGVDAGGGGGGGGGPVVSNTNNWAGWVSLTSCPPWNPIPYSWKSPRTTGVGTKTCASETLSFYDAYLGPSASAAAQAAWDASNAACKICLFSNWSDPTWGPIVRTPNGHLVLNQAGCSTIKDPGRVSCAYSSWNLQQCGVEACDSSGSQSAYQSCLNTAGGALNASCGNASNGKGLADDTFFRNGSAAWDACYAVGFVDNDKQTASRVMQAFCY